MFSRKLWISAVVALFVSNAHAADSFEGDMTAYTLGSTSSGNCNFMDAPPPASQNYAAINGAQWESTKSCGRCAEVSCADARCSDTSKTTIVHILDQCPECKYGDLDVSPSVFKTLTGSDPSRYNIKWRFVPCPITGNIKYCLKSGSNPYYTAIQPANTAAGVKSMTINTKATSMVTSAYYYLLEAENLDLSSVLVSVTSLSGEVISETVSLTAGSCTQGARQFTSGAAPVSPAITPAATPAPFYPTMPSTESPPPPSATQATNPPQPATTAPTPAPQPLNPTPSVATVAPTQPTSSSPAKTDSPISTTQPTSPDHVAGDTTPAPSSKKPSKCRVKVL